MANKFIQVRGVPEINRRLRRLEAKQGRQAISRAIKESLKPIRAAAIAKAPRKTGKMAKAIRVRSRRTRRGISYAVQLGAKNFAGETFYGAFQEFGHAVGPRSLGEDRRWWEGRHFMEEAYEEGHAAAEQRAPGLILQQIERILARG